MRAYNNGIRDGFHEYHITGRYMPRYNWTLSEIRETGTIDIDTMQEIRKRHFCDKIFDKCYGIALKAVLIHHLGYTSVPKISKYYLAVILFDYFSEIIDDPDENFDYEKPDICVEIKRAKRTPFECPICYENVPSSNAVELNCGHKFCGDCISNSLKQVSNVAHHCALCRTDITGCSVSNKKLQKEINSLIA